MGKRKGKLDGNLGWELGWGKSAGTPLSEANQKGIQPDTREGIRSCRIYPPTDGVGQRAEIEAVVVRLR